MFYINASQFLFVSILITFVHGSPYNSLKNLDVLNQIESFLNQEEKHSSSLKLQNVMGTLKMMNLESMLRNHATTNRSLVTEKCYKAYKSLNTDVIGHCE